MVTGEHLIEELRRLAESQRLERRALEACDTALAALAAEDGHLSGFDRSEVILRVARQALVFEHALLSYPFVEVQVGLYVAAKPPSIYLFDLIPVGCYRLITTLDGETDDDYLEFTETKEQLLAYGDI